MAGETAQEKTEEPTEKRLNDAREKGQLPRSRELSTLLVLTGGGLSLMILGPALLADLGAVMRYNFVLDQPIHAEPALLLGALHDSIAGTLMAMLPFFSVMMVVAALGPLMLGGWSLSAKSLGADWSRIDPIKGLGRVFSIRGLVELLKALAKVILLGVLAGTWLWNTAPVVTNLGFTALEVAVGSAGDLVLMSFAVATLPMIIIAGIDVPFQLWEHTRQLKMSRQEVKDDSKETEGNPEVRSRMRKAQQEMSQRRMMAEVPDADVIIVNPIHFAVALKYREAEMAAPVLVAKGVDEMALRIIETGRLHNVPTVRSPLLARALYFNAELDQRIPTALFLAVAQVLAYLYQLRRDDDLGQGQLELDGLPVPNELRTE
jgi:flagellar biosynthetic protein FlhB